MRTIMMLTALAFTAAHAQTTYKCTVAEGRAVYQGRPCESSGARGKAMDLHVIDADPENRARLERQQLIDEAAELRRERDAALREAEQARHRPPPAPSQDEKCAAIQRQAREAAEWKEVFHNPGRKAIEERKRKEAADRFFTECPGKVLTYK